MTAKTVQARKWQKMAYVTGASAGLIALTILTLPAEEKLHARGPMNSGHEALACDQCHRPAPGSLRQQIQANVRYWLGLREQPADFGRQAVGNAVCLDCHERPNDRHPVYRFLEPRFLKARQAIGPQNCLSCHAEHRGQRVTHQDVGYCVNCHEETKLRKDPLDVPHDRLIALKQWDSCLGCHDFHGNHIYRVPAKTDKIVSPDHIRAYFGGGPSPYGNALHYKAKKEIRDGT